MPETLDLIGMGHDEMRICRYCGRISLVPVIQPGDRMKSGWRCTNAEYSTQGVVQHIG